MNKTLFSLALAALPAGAVLAAPQVPALDTTAPQAAPASFSPAPPVNMLSRHDGTLTARERHAVKISRAWVNNRDMPTFGENGRVVFTFGSTLPTIVCAPLQICDLSLQPGEVVNQIDVGDPVRWKLTPATSGPAAAPTTHVVIKPTDIGLVSNMIINTDRRTYNIKLSSRRHDWMPEVAFAYPEDAQAQWANYRQRQAQHQARTLATGENLSGLDFNYTVSGDSPTWKPVRVYNTGAKTYIEFPASIKHDDLPVLVAIGDDSHEQLVNYRLVGNRFEIDKILSRGELISGVGRHQTKVEIAYSGRQ